jgi:hypothetical protein
VYDLPGVVACAPPMDRIEFVGGDFFKGVPAGGDCYVLKHIIHDWNDAQCVTILSNIARAMAANGRLFVIEAVMPESPDALARQVPRHDLFAVDAGGIEGVTFQPAQRIRVAALATHRVCCKLSVWFFAIGGGKRARRRSRML